MTSEWDDKIIIFTDGACSGNPGKGGWASVIYTPNGKIQELGAASFKTTNNQMELTASIEGLKAVANKNSEIWLYTDSTYVIRGITQWIWGWKKKDWKNAEGNDVTNQDLWLQLEKQVLRLKKQGTNIDWRYVRGHTGVPGNERVDEIAVNFSKGKGNNLFSGRLLEYSVAILDLPETHELPPMREKQEKKAAYSYLSYVNGVLQRHKDWKSCEAVVKGRPGAKFKKALSQEDETLIVETWGLSRKHLDDLKD
ncbi:MAG: reverse transcriptase-like protein [Bdellovibrionales bacterium]|nr:reverse transcriptase-like protein [Bdellovibrionales bacterium]